MRVAYLFTTFPKYSESFLQRELRAMARSPDVEATVYSFHRGRGNTFERFPVQHLRWYDYLLLPLRLPVEWLRAPRHFNDLIKSYIRSRPRSLVNALEQLLGLAFAVSFARRLRKDPPRIMHAVWATAPATAALLLSRINGIPFSMGAHAYDIHRNGGDCLLEVKLAAAAMIHTTTDDARQALLRRGAETRKIHLIRRGLDRIPPFDENRPWSNPLRLVSVGRLVEKKGYFEQVAIYHMLAKAGIPFEARILGDGPLRQALQDAIDQAGLGDRVTLCGQVDYDGVAAAYAWANVFIFTGRIAASGDRDGLPNVIGEAMAAGLVVLSSPVAGTPEAVISGQTGELIPLDQPTQWLASIQRLIADPGYRQHLRKGGHDWVRENFDAHKNARRIAAAWNLTAPSSPHT